jgi:hypothetical protein
MEKVLSVILAVVIGLALAVLLVEWMSGCGESYYDSRGVSHQLPCVFIR